MAPDAHDGIAGQPRGLHRRDASLGSLAGKPRQEARNMRVRARIGLARVLADPPEGGRIPPQGAHPDTGRDPMGEIVAERRRGG